MPGIMPWLDQPSQPDNTRLASTKATVIVPETTQPGYFYTVCYATPGATPEQGTRTPHLSTFTLNASHSGDKCSIRLNFETF